MAANNFSSKTFAELEKMAKSYKTEIATFLNESTSPSYEIADISKEEFKNITNFVMNSVIKDGKEIELAEDGNSRVFSKLLRRYFEEHLSVSDVIELKQFVNQYNSTKADDIYENIYQYVYGIQENMTEADPSMPFFRVVSLIKDKIKRIVEDFETYVYKYTYDNDEWIIDPDTKYSINEPVSPVTGANWFDITTKNLIEKTTSWTEELVGIPLVKPKSSVEGTYWLDVKTSTLYRYYHGEWISRNIIIGTSGTSEPSPAIRNSYFLNTDSTATLKRFDGANWTSLTAIPLYFYSSTTKTLYSTISKVFMGTTESPTQDDVYIDFMRNKTSEEWYGAGSSLLITKVDASEFLERYIEKGKLIETLVFLMIASYLDSYGYESRGVFKNNDGTITRDKNLVLEESSFFKKGNDVYIKDFTFHTENISLVDEIVSYRFDEVSSKYFKRTQKSLEVKDGTRVIMYIPVNLQEIEVEFSGGNYIPKSGASSLIIDAFNKLNITNNTITFLDLYRQLKDNLYEFLGVIKNLSNAGLLNDTAYFYDSTGTHVFTEKLRNDITKIAELYYYKDLIQENWYLDPNTNTTKNFANEYEQTIAKDGQQLIFIDTKDIDLSLETQTTRDTFRTLFGYPVAQYPIGTFSTNKFSYTVLYKELNPVLRESCLIDNQEFIFARLLATSPGKDTLFATKRGGVSFSTAANSFYKTYVESEELFKLPDEFSRYKVFYNNIYISRISNESDLIGYYVGDSSDVSDFIDNYGAKDSEKQEIAAFIDIFRSTRNFYYQVLLNKSFIQEEEYKLYERMIIIFMALERFMNLKIENIHDPDFFNSRDIYNFLESYGLSILNEKRFDFVIGAKDYKLNIVKYFNELVKLKGSRDVINVLLKVFEIPDISIEIRKFLILENTNIETNIVGDSEVKFVDVPYLSDNASREINRALSNAYSYESFIQNDPYWNAQDVPASTLLDLDLDVAETKYLGLILSENIYKKFVLSRYMISTLDYLERNLVKKDGTNVLYNTRLEAGEIFGATSSSVSIYNYFEAIKIVYKALLTLYGIEGSLNIENIGTKFYGLNKNIDWNNINNALAAITNNFSTYDDEFLLASKKVGISGIPSTFDRYNIFKESSDWINYDYSSGSSNRNIFYKKADYQNLTEIAKQLQDLIFSTHKTTSGKADVANEFANPGSYILDLIENLNLLRISNTDHDLWMYILSKYYNKDYVTPSDVSTFDQTGSNLDYKDLYYKVLEKIMQFPVDYFDGILSPYRDVKFHNKAFVDLIETLFKEIYISEEDSLAFAEYWINSSDSNRLYKYNNTTKDWELRAATLSTTEPGSPSNGAYWINTDNNYKLYQYDAAEDDWVELDRYIQQVPPISDDITEYLEEPINIVYGTMDLPLSGTDELTALIEKYTTEILRLIDGLRTLFASEPYMQFSLSLKTEEQETLKFVQTAVEVFLSYTTELYYTSYKKAYNSYSEIMPLAEEIKHRLDSRKLDFVFYDESLNVELMEEPE